MLINFIKQNKICKNLRKYIGKNMSQNFLLKINRLKFSDEIDYQDDYI